MKTTLNIKDQLLAQAKAAAAREHSSLSKLVEEGLRLRLRSPSAHPARKRKAAIPVFRGKSGLAPGIDPSSNESLFKETTEFISLLPLGEGAPEGRMRACRPRQREREK